MAWSARTVREKLKMPTLPRMLEAMLEAMYGRMQCGSTYANMERIERGDL